MDPNKQEQAFRAAEAQLDLLLVQAKPELERHAISSTDRSVRSYNYKDPYLSWGVNFERSWSQDLFICLVQVWVFCPQPVHPDDSPQVTVRRWVERFRTGQQSSFNEKFEQTHSLHAVGKSGLASIVIKEFALSTQGLGVML